MTPSEFKALALSFQHAVALPHFELLSFRVNKKIFATYNEPENKACIMLNAVDQSVFVDLGKSFIYPVPNKWGQGGATYFELDQLNSEIVQDALQCAYNRKLGHK